ncbi:1604_t:CDS:2 [Entrophospora sp. SA101]|nr:10622_t:CDS:2 [Entrophospora sp. SA101]CAJ0853415.1 1604_t:CDS:2 [Entrophospora sp. SA101]
MNYQNSIPSNEQLGSPTIPSKTYSGHYHVHQNSNIPINVVNNFNGSNNHSSSSYREKSNNDNNNDS